MLNANRSDVYTDLNALAKLKTEARKESPEALKAAAKQFEGVFLNQVLKSMRESKLADGILDNEQSKFYSEMYDQQLASNLSGSVGLADLIVKQMKREEADDDKAGKMNLEDYLNRSSTAGKSMPSRHGEVDSRTIGKIDKSHEEPDPAIGNEEIEPASVNGEKLATDNGDSEFAFKKSGDLPIHSAQDFVRHLHPIAERAARELGVEPKVLLAQAALETNWGRSLIKNREGESTFNLFNIKAGRGWQGEQVSVKALEFERGVGRKTNAGFRAYDSFEESFQDYVRLIKNNPRYGDALKQADSPERYLRGLQHAGYATDPKYAEKIISIYRGATMNNIQPDLAAAMRDQA
ncbi:flagellar assembly peptidoglycan hydrolase FlgJ [Candidatus Methylomicrobium oryzae]|jgi:flagellar protein FlgJ|uniref:flagellar assembly peptidoglycan hydrolase FlgJ n=1 Tax=Candidatus Methylomicrobium oryzae TaxID=2802053 RepID=UPI001921D140|nr:flagellar assembly peptidoglycan hydrolase FlgJ [Methylomicrobium sp. RS1]MBL1265158.1 flagellar assembly peptidoglycan hydrolase FlgJ [Methylomicrobium sp. RS1]